MELDPYADPYATPMLNLHKVCGPSVYPHWTLSHWQDSNEWEDLQRLPVNRVARGDLWVMTRTGRRTVEDRHTDWGGGDREPVHVTDPARRRNRIETKVTLSTPWPSRSGLPEFFWERGPKRTGDMVFVCMWGRNYGRPSAVSSRRGGVSLSLSLSSSAPLPLSLSLPLSLALPLTLSLSSTLSPSLSLPLPLSLSPSLSLSLKSLLRRQRTAPFFVWSKWCPKTGLCLTQPYMI